MKIIKHSGLVVDFDTHKLKNSLLKSGASSDVVEKVLSIIQDSIYEGITTKQIYKLAFSLLKKASNSHAAQYNLRESLRLLGPAGFFFEKYIARLFQSEGYDAKTNLTLQGKCVSHEIDVAIQKKNTIEMIECKFHVGRDAVTDVKVPLYILSRFHDVAAIHQELFSRNDTVSGCWIVTNNRFSSDAIKFAICSGLQLLSWDYPKTHNLKEKIDRNQLYPVTCLTTLSLSEKEKLLILEIILVKELIAQPSAMQKIGISEIRIKKILKEASQLCHFI